MTALLARPADGFTPRPYQAEAVEAVRAGWAEGEPGQLVVVCTGGGKTLLALSLVATEPGRVVWLAHRKELLDQPHRALCKHWPHLAGEAGIVQASRDQAAARIVFASVATLAVPHRLDRVLDAGAPDLVVVDEAHHSVAKTHEQVIEALGAPRRLGLTATADREDGADLSEHWEIAYSYGIVDAIADGWLVPPYAAVVPLPELDLTAVSGRRDYDDAELGAALLKARVVEHTVDALAEAHLATRLPDRGATACLRARGRATLVFTATIEQARLTAQELRAAGWWAAHVSGETGSGERDQLLADLDAGKVEVVCNAAVWTEGADIPRVSCIVLARPTKSWAFAVQMLGRGTRLYDGKGECLVIDLAGATDLHDLRAAPVLIGGSRCLESPNRVHDFEGPTDDGKGVCRHCGRKVACFERLGPHDYHEGACRTCGRPQCGESKDGRHHWVPQADHKRMCLECGIEVPDPLAGMTRRRDREPVDQRWLRLDGLVPETYVVDVDPHGFLYVVGEREGGGSWQLIWLRKGGRRPRPLTSGPVPSSEVRVYADDLVRRSARVGQMTAGWRLGGPTRRQWDYIRLLGLRGNWRTAGEVADAITLHKARERAVAVGVAR